MKKLVSFFAPLFLLLFSFGANAQTAGKSDYFIGKWNVVVEGTPNGDAKMLITIERKDTALTGNIVDPTTKEEISKITRIEEKENAVVLYFNAQGYDVNLLLEKKSDDHVEGNLLEMFEAKGDRVKPTKS